MSKKQTEKQESYTSPFEAIRKETEEGGHRILDSKRPGKDT